MPFFFLLLKAIPSSEKSLYDAIDHSFIQQGFISWYSEAEEVLTIKLHLEVGFSLYVKTVTIMRLFKSEIVSRTFLMIETLVQ